MNHMNWSAIVAVYEYLLFIECIMTVKSDFDRRIDVQFNFCCYFADVFAVLVWLSSLSMH